MKNSFYHYLIKPLFLAVALLPLSSCGLIFDDRPKTMTIEYDEEVKLHDDSMIWVHITRHYYLGGGGALGDPGAFTKNYVQNTVEISWDSGFEGVGRKSVFFKKYIGMIDKYNDNWYVVGSKPDGSIQYSKSANCSKIGVSAGFCIASVNKDGKFVVADVDELLEINNINIFNTIQVIKDGDIITPKVLDDKRLSWDEKLALQSQQIEKKRNLGKALFTKNIHLKSY